MRRGLEIHLLTSPTDPKIQQHPYCLCHGASWLSRCDVQGASVDDSYSLFSTEPRVSFDVIATEK